ncbi:hypothetical protein Pmani_027422 [Petrolisthes manimaculis]|uniref:Uncharacterized protein n=1 Tax=Petrolisthes manimaculis TaxID=1843537 RepID=A0AAE1TZ29_9EUCA|nr:hypothetical protein Pmani_027422 [Petrolisthes manimaculis]
MACPAERQTGGNPSRSEQRHLWPARRRPTSVTSPQRHTRRSLSLAGLQGDARSYQVPHWWTSDESIVIGNTVTGKRGEKGRERVKEEKEKKERRYEAKGGGGEKQEEIKEKRDETENEKNERRTEAGGLGGKE